MILLLHGIYKNLTHRNFYSRRNYKILKNYIIGFKGHLHRQISFLKDINREEGSETTLYDTTVGTHLMLHLSKPTECTTPRANPSVDFGLIDKDVSMKLQEL